MEYPAVYRYDTKKAWRVHWITLACFIVFGTLYTIFDLRHSSGVSSWIAWGAIVSLQVIWQRLHLERSQVTLLDDRIAIDEPMRPRLVIMNAEIEAVDVDPNPAKGMDVYWRGRKIHIKAEIDRFGELRDELVSRANQAASLSPSLAALHAP